MPLDRGIVDQQLQAIGAGTAWWEYRELRDLPAVLHSGERIVAVARGKIARVRVLRRSWLIVLTDARLVCLKSYRRSWQQFEVDLDAITRVSMRVGPFRGRVLISAGTEKLRFLLPRHSAFRLHGCLTQMITPVEQSRGFGPARVLRRVLDHMLALPAAAFNAEARPALPAVPKPIAQDHTAVEHAHQLEKEVGHLRQQVEFLEQLLNASSHARATAQKSELPPPQ